MKKFEFYGYYCQGVRITRSGLVRESFENVFNIILKATFLKTLMQTLKGAHNIEFHTKMNLSEQPGDW